MIVGIQSGGIGNVDVSPAAGGTGKTKSSDKETGSFADLMNLASSAAGTVQTIPQMPSAEKKTDTVEPVKTKETAFDTKQNRKIQVEEKESASDTAPNADNIKKLSDKLKKLLKITDEELQKYLQDAGLTLQDLFDPETLQNFVLFTQEKSPVDLLIDESLGSLVQQAVEELNAVSAATQNPETVAENPAVLTDMEPSNHVEQIPYAEEQPVEEADAIMQPLRDETEMRDVSSGQKPETESITGSPKEVPVVTVASQMSEDAEHSSNMTGQMYQQVILNLDQALTQTVVEDVAVPTMDQTLIVQQIVDQMKVELSKDVTSMTLQLNPEQLGKVQIHVVSKEGSMQAQIIAETETAKHAVETGLAVLKEAFENQDLKVDSIEVLVGTQDYFSDGEAQAQTNAESKEQNHGNHASGINLQSGLDDELNEDQQLEAEMMKAQGNQVSYMV